MRVVIINVSGQDSREELNMDIITNLLGIVLNEPRKKKKKEEVDYTKMLVSEELQPHYAA